MVFWWSINYVEEVYLLDCYQWLDFWVMEVKIIQWENLWDNYLKYQDCEDVLRGWANLGGDRLIYIFVGLNLLNLVSDIQSLLIMDPI